MKTHWLFTALLPALLLGCAATPPSRLEDAVLSRAKHGVIRGRFERNPLTATAENLAQGAEKFEAQCVACHGNDGQLTGVPFARTMDPPVADLQSPAVQRYTDGQLKWIIKNGIFPSGMPSWRHVLSEREMWQVVLYMRNLPAKGSLGVPEFYAPDNDNPGSG